MEVFILDNLKEDCNFSLIDLKENCDFEEIVNFPLLDFPYVFPYYSDNN